MRIIAEQTLPTDLGTFRQFIDKATQLVDGDVTALVTHDGGSIRVCSAKEIER